eukprot:5266963-Karenia_brevis.AAC.1
MSPQDLKLMQRPDAPIKRDEALRWLARQNRATPKAAAGSAVSAGPVNPKFVGVDPDMSQEDLEALMAAADARYQELETLAPWRDPKVPVGKSAPKERPRSRKGRQGRSKGNKGKAKKEEESLSGDEFADINPLTIDQ